MAIASTCPVHNAALDEAQWHALIGNAPALVYLLACTRRGAYAIGAAPDRAAIGSALGHIVGRQHPMRRQWPSLVWLQPMASLVEAEKCAHGMRRWSHAWQRRLIEQANPAWTNLDDILSFKPQSLRQCVPETDPKPPEPAEAARRVAAEAEAARQAISALPSRQAWSGAEASWWYSRLQAAPWGVSVFAGTRCWPYRIEATPGRVLEAVLISLNGYNEARRRAWEKFPPWRWVWFEPHASEAEARSRQATLRRWPHRWQRTLIAHENPGWYGLETLLTGCPPDRLEEFLVPERWLPSGADA